ncbi:MAG: Heme A synthase [Alphaproteobacteria bacterium ADurb.BinA280]|jgi:heme a synthase|nr:COX15/CtaA family protein [Xanthomonadales bacterium]MCC6506981.1 COX15/CtaA family protein [Aquimonas sp.]OPZ12854.1 MAG: Heme A synthase [Alphaproteobacteria bacterium ADurb.BinA280]
MIKSLMHVNRLAWIAVLLALCVIAFGAFVRLSHAGLSCPDWPTCYGKATWPVHAHEIAHANANFERPVETHKAWREQFHRHIAALLGVLVLTLAIVATRHRRYAKGIILGASALVAVAIPLYMREWYVASSVLVVTAELILLGMAFRWDNRDFARAATLTLALIIFQAMLGMWTVTWLLKPVVVMGHLLGGMATFAMLTWLAHRASPFAVIPNPPGLHVRGMLVVGIALVVVQIALGGWVSANYAALACGVDFPACQGQWWPRMNFSDAFVLWRGIGVDYEGGVLDADARTAIQMVHRMFALVVFGHVLALAVRLIRDGRLPTYGWSIGFVLCLQVALGITNVMAGLPLKVATAHNAFAAILLFLLVGLLARLRPAPVAA